MRLSDLVETTTEQNDLLNTIEEMIVRSKARGFSKMSTPTMLAKLNSLGYVIKMENLLELLTTVASVGSANNKIITLDIAIPDRPQNDDGKEQVKKLASKQLMKGRKS